MTCERCKALERALSRVLDRATTLLAHAKFCANSGVPWPMIETEFTSAHALLDAGVVPFCPAPGERCETRPCPDCAKEGEG